MYDVARRLEPVPGVDYAAGIRAEVADPAWFLGRQWQLGEHQGEDASSPVRVAFKVATVPLGRPNGRPRLDPATVPTEALIEGEQGDWWTPGRRIRLGRTAGRLLEAPQPRLRLRGLAPPYDGFNGTEYDGRLLWERRAALGLPADVFAEVPQRGPAWDQWNPTRLGYDTDLPLGDAKLQVRDHRGGEVDWWAGDATADVQATATTAEVVAVPDRLRFAAAPLPRWWQIEDATVDLGGYPPDRAHLANLLLTSIVSGRSDDWFVIPVGQVPGRGGRAEEAAAGAPAGTALRLVDVEVTDVFDQTYRLEPPADWSLFAVRGLAPDWLLVLLTTPQPLTGLLVDEVALGIDEDANLAWAVEIRADGRELETSAAVPDALPGAPATASAERDFRYRAASSPPRRRHPYRLETDPGGMRFVEQRLVDLDAPEPAARSAWAPRPSAPLLDPQAGPHRIDAAVMRASGWRLGRQWVLARGTDATPVLWAQRSRSTLLMPPSTPYRFDLVERPPE